MLWANKHQFNPSPGHSWHNARLLRFSILMQLCFSIAPWRRTTAMWVKHFSRNSSSFFFLPRLLFSKIPAESALIITVSPLLTEDREQQLGERSSTLNSTDCRRFSHHFLLWILTSIVMNTLERCLTAWAWIGRTLERLFVCASVCAGLHVCCAHLCLPVHPHASLGACALSWTRYE